MPSPGGTARKRLVGYGEPRSAPRRQRAAPRPIATHPKESDDATRTPGRRGRSRLRAPPSSCSTISPPRCPTIAKLMGEGMYGDLASITPPITVPAWACAITGTTPGQLGIYGFRNRKDTTYEGCRSRTRARSRRRRSGTRSGAQGKRSVLIGVPPSFPPPKEFPGWRVGCFLTPPSAERWAYPQELEVEIEEELGGKGQYIFDIPNFRQAGYDVTLDQVFKMTERRFQVGRRHDPEQAVGLLHAVRHRARPAAPRVLAVLRPAPPALRGREQVRGGLPGLLPVPGQAARGRSSS